MKYYETLYIAHPILETGRLKDTIENVQKLIEKNEKNSVLCTDVWGKKKLAYPIEKQKYGTYVLVQYSGDGKMINNVNIELEHNVNILAYMTIEIFEGDITEQKGEIESQILGNVNQDNGSDKKNQKKSFDKVSIENKTSVDEALPKETIEKESTEKTTSEETTEEATSEEATEDK